MSEQSFFTTDNDGSDMEVFYNFEPSQKLIMSGPNSCPYYPARITINRVMISYSRPLIYQAGLNFGAYRVMRQEIQVSADEENRLIELAFEDIQEQAEANLTAECDAAEAKRLDG